jgi:NTP pyrophosphatase (non-canonical NTP hydrolase)
MTPIEMKDVYEDVYRINAIDPATPILRFCKLSEEFGELAQAVNKKLGRKVIKESEQEVLDLILEESADTIQCAFSFMDEIGIDYELYIPLGATIEKGEILEIDIYDYSPEEFIASIEVSKGEIAKLLLEGMVEGDGKICHHRDNCGQLVAKVFCLAGIYGFTPGNVLDKIAIKNVKWEKVANKRKDEQEK